MRIRILGGGWYGCHLAAALMLEHDVELLERADRLFAGASGSNPARLHLGFHYPRSKLTRAMCQEGHRQFMDAYGELTETVPVNIYAIARDLSQVDFGNYVQSLRNEVEFIVLDRPDQLGLRNVEGAILTGERHIVIDRARDYFAKRLGGLVSLGGQPRPGFLPELTIDCTFCALDAQSIDRYEPCVTGILESVSESREYIPSDRAVTIMDGPFPSIYPWNPALCLSSLTSAKFTPLSREKSYEAAQAVIDATTTDEAAGRCALMLDQMRHFWPECLERYHLVDVKLSIRALPLSGADSRLVDVVTTAPDRWRIRAGKIDAVLYAEQLIRERICLRLRDTGPR